MTYAVHLETGAKREFAKLPREMQEALAEAMDDLARDPRPPGAKKLACQNGYRVRKGKYRVLYTVADKVRLVRVYRVGHRREVYR